MFGSEILEVAIGIIFIFILVSIICSAIREAMEAWLKTRSAYLAYGIRELLHDRDGTGLAKAFYDHPQIYGLFQGNYHSPGSEKPQVDHSHSGSEKPPSILAKGGNLPSYIPAKNFAIALMDIAVRGPVTNNVSSDPGSSVISLETLRTNIFNLQNQFVQRALLAAIDSAQGNFDQAQANLEDWYDSAMDRVSGWYKRSTQWILFWIGLFVAVSLNINTLTIASYLFRNDTARANLVALAEARVDSLRTVADTATAEASQIARKELASLQLPIGWADGRRVGAPAPVARGKNGSESFWSIVWHDWIIAIPGWLLTALAVTMGAPFWFDVLNKVMVIRSTVKPHEKSPEESSEDRQRGVKQPAGVGPQDRGDRAEGAGGAGGVGAASDPLASPPDEESDIDACGVDPDDAVTPDEMLPEAKGGVA